MKVCAKCKTEKPLEDFHKNRRSKNGLYSYCKPCSNAKVKKYFSNLSSEKKDEYNHRNNLKKKFNLTPEQYEKMLSSQKAVCAICHKPDSEGKRLAVDHCHETGIIRGLLCGHCNTGLGKFFDNISYLEQAIHYLKNVETT